MEVNQFVVWDYVVFAVVLLVSAGIGIFYGCTGGKQKTTGEFLMANKQMGVLPVTLSLLASFMSAITLLGTPAEIYRYGMLYWWIWIGYAIMIPTIAHYFVPVFFRLNITTVYEYLEMRFNSKFLRAFGACAFIVQMVLYLAIVLYAPSLALNQVTGLNVWISVAAVGVVCTFYTTIGGMKAVLWTDSFQVIMMMAGLIAVLVQGSIDFNGFDNIWEAAKEGGRLNFWEWDLSPMKRHTFWTLSIGGAFNWLSIYLNQAQIQRALCLPTLKKAQLCMWLNLPLLTGLLTVCCLCGLVIFAEYKDCDPLTNPNGAIGAADQLLPYYVIQNFSKAPGLPGLFTAGLFSGALSTISSGLNSLAAVTLKDVIMLTPRWKDLPDEKGATISRIIACVYGILCLALTLVAAEMGDVLQAALALFGMIGGPQLGLFFLGMSCPFANWIGGVVGLFVSLVITFWVGIGSQIYKHPTPLLNVSIAGCPVPNITDFTTMSYMTTEFIAESEPARDLVYDWYGLSYLHYGTLAFIVVMVVGPIVSLLTGSNKKEDMHPRYLQPIADVFCCCLPGESVNWCRCHMDKYTEDMDEEEQYCDKEEQSIDTKPTAATQNHIRAVPEGVNDVYYNPDNHIREVPEGVNDVYYNPDNRNGAPSIPDSYMYGHDHECEANNLGYVHDEKPSVKPRNETTKI